MKEKKNKTDYKLLKKLIKNDKFIKEILKLKDNKSLIEKFDLYGVNLKNIDFTDLCTFLENEADIRKINYEVKSIDSPLMIDSPCGKAKTIIKFKEI